MHRLSYISIKNFRACRDVSLPLDNCTPLVGLNNTGKSTILNAIQWVLKPTALTQNDFGVDDEEVIVSACIDGISEEILDQVADQKHRAAIEPYCVGDRLWIRVVAAKPGAKNLVREVWDIEKCSADQMPDEWRNYPTGLPQAVSSLLPDPLYVEAMQDVAEDLGKAKAGTTIKGLLDEIMIPVLQAHDELGAALDTIKNILTTEGDSRSDHLKTFDTDATQALSHFFPGLELDLDLQVVDIKEFFKAGDLHVTDKLTGDRRRFNQIGTGAQRAIQMALIRHLADTRTPDVATSTRRLLLIDEPEVYLHPQGVRRLRSALEQLSELGFQVIYSTHSPMMLCRENAPGTVLVSKSHGNGVVAQKPLREAAVQALEDAPSQARTLFELGNVSEIYFSEIVVLCEGKTDQRLLPLAYKIIYQRYPEVDNIAFISLGSCSGIPKALSVLEAMGIKAMAVADLDFGFTHARTGGLLDKDAQDLVDIKALLAALEPVHGFSLAGNGLPQNQKNGWNASDAWALVAGEPNGKLLADSTHEALKEQSVWIWPAGCIEQVTGCETKGEEAIREQEDMLGSMDADALNTAMPDFRACFDWIRG